jgi:Ca2+-binding RTX toxin-like protein
VGRARPLLLLGLALALAGCGGPAAAPTTGSSTADESASGNRAGSTGAGFCDQQKLDVVEGTEAQDLLIGVDKAQAFEALGDNDLVKTGPGGGCIDLSAGDDSAIGGSGADLIGGGDGDDFVQPGGGDDRVLASLGKDYVVGSPGDDDIGGGVGSDVLNGGPGNDRVFGAANSDLLAGGTGDDRIDSADGYKDLVDCREGKDAVLADKLDILKGCKAVKVIKKKPRAKGHAKKHEAARAAALQSTPITQSGSGSTTSN